MGKTITSYGTWYSTDRGQRYHLFQAADQDCQACALRAQCLKNPGRERGRQATRFEPKVRSATDASERMRCAIDSVRGRHLFCMVHNIEKLANSGWRQ